MGSMCASILYYPSLLLLQITEFFANLPGSIVAIGKISLLALIIIYILICLVWFHQKFRRQWWLFLIFSMAIVVIPNIYNNWSLFKISILEANNEPIVVIQDQGEVVLINSGKNQNIVKYNIIPFLVSQGINKIDYGVALNTKYNSGDSFVFENFLTFP